MGYEIEHKKKVIKLSASLGSEPDYFAMHELASNNVRPRTFEYCYAGYGWEYRIIGSACNLSAEAESGMLKPYDKWVKAEEYITQWRRALQNAIPFSDFIKQNSLKFEIAVIKDKFDKRSEVIKKEWEKRTMDEILPKTEIEDKKFFDTDLKLVTIQVKEEQDIRDFVSLMGIFKDNKLIYYINIKEGY